MKIKSWRINLDRAELRVLLDWAVRRHKADRVLMVIRAEKHGKGWRPLDPLAFEWITKQLTPFSVKSFLAKGWPGTLLSDSLAFVHVFKFDKRVRDILLQTEARLQNWLHNRDVPLPEDICLFRADATLPVLMSVTHEGSAWLIDDHRPRLAGLSADFAPRKESYIFSGEYFCLK
jgi:hypothetical protein